MTTSRRLGLRLMGFFRHEEKRQLINTLKLEGSQEKNTGKNKGIFQSGLRIFVRNVAF